MQIEGVSISLKRIRRRALYAYQGIECILPLRGQLTVERNGCSFLLETDHVLVLNNGELHAFSGDENHDILFLQISDGFLLRSCEELLTHPITCCSANDKEQERYYQIKRILTQMLFLAMKEEKTEFLSLLFRLLNILRRDYSAPPAEAPGLLSAVSGVPELENVLLYLNHNYQERLTLADMAAMTYLSPQSFSKLFHKKVGMGFLAYLAQVRAEAAASKLLSTDHTITQIAAETGFANSKALTEAFRQSYGLTPGDYRNTHTLALGTGEVEEADVTESLRSNFLSLSMFADELSESAARQSSHIECRYDLSHCPEHPAQAFSFARLVLLDDGICSILRQDVREQLEIIQQDLRFDYALIDRFSLSECTNMLSSGFGAPGAFTLENLPLHHVLNAYFQMGLALYLRLDLSAVMAAYPEPQAFYTRFTHFLRELCQCPLRAMAEKTRLELGCSDPAHLPHFPYFARQISYLTHTVFPCAVGLFTEEWMLCSGQPLPQAGQIAPLFRFAGFNALPRHEFDGRVVLDAASHLDKFTQKIEQVQLFLKANQITTQDLNLVRWHTLAGKSETRTTAEHKQTPSSNIEWGTFFRSAIILQTLDHLRGWVQGITFPCRTISKEDRLPSLALFLMSDIKRPAYFVLEAARRLAGDILVDDPNIIITQTPRGSYTVAVLVPNYANPRLSLDRYYVEHESRSFLLHLTGLPQGLYTIKRLSYEKNHSGIFERMREIGLMDISDPDVNQRLKTIIQPDLYLYSQRVTEELILRAEVPFNAIVLFEVQRNTTPDNANRI